jgi:histone deacetylase HOS3
LYESKYAVILEKTRAYLKSQTERLRSAGLNSRAAIFISAGFDASEYEDPGMQRHSVNVPTEFYARFTRDLVRIAAEEGTSVEGRIVSVLEGGYSDRALCSGVFSHLCGLAGDGPSNQKQEPIVIGSEAGQTRARKDSSASERGARRYESSWWAPAELDELEATLAKPVPAPRIIRNSPEPNYASPTQASQARAVAPSSKRSISGLSAIANLEASKSLEPPSPLEVPWAIAACELTKLLIPTERKTTSYTAEELNAEATKIRRERQAALAASNLSQTGTIPEERPSTRMAL